MPTRKPKQSEQAALPAHTTIRLSYASRERLKVLMQRAEHIHQAQRELGQTMYKYHQPSVDEFVEMCLVEMERVFEHEERRLLRIRERQEAARLAKGGEVG